ncbi:hypothetical protein CTEN210_10502 [Chaetoceros tenuissimus]|uniref:Uncharacterized protein n=1 Tax=Chaetoceros tenuissimus TaxID=426638 RepID=A0AAD3CXK9_9STRA|nr:hypothetical protein CTEN210_10502 [Chaetoceros tenuissimus]
MHVSVILAFLFQCTDAFHSSIPPTSFTGRKWLTSSTRTTSSKRRRNHANEKVLKALDKDLKEIDDSVFKAGLSALKFINSASKKASRLAQKGIAKSLQKDTYEDGDLDVFIHTNVEKAQHQAKQSVAKLKGKEIYEDGDFEELVNDALEKSVETAVVLDYKAKQRIARMRGKDKYEFLDLEKLIDESIKAQINKFTNKSEYQIGDLSKEIYQRVKTRDYSKEVGVIEKVIEILKSMQDKMSDTDIRKDWIQRELLEWDRRLMEEDRDQGRQLQKFDERLEKVSSTNKAKSEIDGTKSSKLILCTQRHDPKGYIKVKKYVYQLMDENPSRRGIEKAFRQRYPQVANRYVKSSLKNTLYRFKKEYKQDYLQDFESAKVVKSARGISNSTRNKPQWDNLDKF